MTHPDNWVQKQIQEMNSMSDEKYVEYLYGFHKGYHEADLHMGVKYTKVPVFKLYYDKTLRMSEGKLAAQVGHVVAQLTLKHGKVPSKIIVLEASHTKFESYCESADYVQRDMGLTEVEEGTATVCGSVEFE